MGALAKGLKPGLYAITDARLTPDDRLVSCVEAALRGGAVLVQYRDKSASARERLRQATELQAVCRNAGVPLIINDDPELARRVGAAGAHLGQRDGSLAEARRLLGEDAILGATCHARLDLAHQAVAQGADYLAFGRFHRSATKPEAPAAPRSVLTHARHLGRPVTAIGGITLANARPLIEAGADLLAVVGGLFGGTPEQIEATARAFQQLFTEPHPSCLSQSTGAQP